jgi:hypothetical protein
MQNLQQRISNGVTIFKSNILLFLLICTVSSIIAIFTIPFLINSYSTQQEIGQELGKIGVTYGGTLIFTIDQITASLISLLQLSVTSTALLIAAYLVKYIIDKKIFRINRWRDWKFFLYISGISLLIVDVFQKITMGTGNGLIANFLLTILSCFIVVIISAVLLPEEIPEIKMI